LFETSEECLREKKRHGESVDAYVEAYKKYTHDRKKLIDWLAANAEDLEEKKLHDGVYRVYLEAYEKHKKTRLF